MLICFASVLQSLPSIPAPSPLAFTLDVAQLVMLGGLIWGLAKMSASVDELRKVTEKLTETSESFREAMEKIVLRVHGLEIKEDHRRDRRQDDAK